MITINEIESLKFDENGLIPAVVQDTGTLRVLTVAYMNRQSLEISLNDGYTCFWSRSRKELWRKGETSGNKQKIVDIQYDCDKDALLVLVKKAGPACHTGNDSCFDAENNNSFSGGDVIDQLYSLLLDRISNPKEGSYTSYLFEKGLDKILKKVGEESAEVIIAAKGGENAETVYEIADLAYHVLVLMAKRGITPGDVRSELASRHVVDHKVKQEKPE